MEPALVHNIFYSSRNSYIPINYTNFITTVMIPRIHSAELVQATKEEMWLVYFHVIEEPRFAQVRMVPVASQPKTCLGGMWCKDFGCIPGDNVFTRSEPEILVEKAGDYTLEEEEGLRNGYDSHYHGGWSPEDDQY